MLIAYLNPFTQAAENQAAFSLAKAGRDLGVELVACNSPEAVEELRPEFVLSVTSSIPKVVDVPSYLTVHEPTSRFLRSPHYFRNLLSYDGYLTISDSLTRFITDVCAGVGRPQKPGFYYNSPQTLSLNTDLAHTARDGRISVAYIGTNWDRRMPRLFRALDRENILRIYGPRHSWIKEGYANYAGPLPFDGESPQRTYAKCGMGLVLLSKDHLREDVISNRIFEIASVGAVAVCPDIPWIRKWFDDTVLYLPRRVDPGRWAEAIAAFHAWCSEEPVAAQTMARRARLVFEKHFAAEHMLANLLAYHDTKQRPRKAQARTPAEPRISVIVRCGGRPVSAVQSAVDSIARQTFGRFTVIFAKYQDIDLSSVTSTRHERIEGWHEVGVPGGTRAETLYAGLGSVATEYFAILDDDDFWLGEHIESLFDAALQTDSGFDVAFAGSVCISSEPKEIEKNLWWHRNIYTFGFRGVPRSASDVVRDFSSNCFIARSELIAEALKEVPSVLTAEDSLVVALVTRRKKPVFSYRATAFFRRGQPGESEFLTDAAREADLLSVRLRAEMLSAPAWIATSSLPPDVRGPFPPLRAVVALILDFLKSSPPLSERFDRIRSYQWRSRLSDRWKAVRGRG